MDAVTYPHRQVKEELSSWVVVRVNIEERREVATLFGVDAIPVAVAVDAGGRELGRAENFVEPAKFRRLLETWRRRLADLTP